MPVDRFDWVLDQPYISPWELEARGKPGPGPDFKQQADAETGLGELRTRLKLKDYADTVERDRLKEQIADRDPRFRELVDYEYRRATYHPYYTLNIRYRGRVHADVPFLRGGLWGAECFGPTEFARSDVMVIGKHPGKIELEVARNFQGPTSQQLIRACRECGIGDQDYLSWYATNLVKFDRPDNGSGQLPQPWVADCLPILWQELIFVRPRFILCLGSEAIKTILGSSYNVSNTAGRMLSLPYRAAPRGRPVESYADLEEHTAIVMCVPHPAYVHRQPDAFESLRLGIEQFWELARGRIEPVEHETGVRHMAVYSAPVLASIVDCIRARPGDLTIAFDAEWHGKSWNDDDSYLRTIQFAPAWKEAYCVVLTDPGNVPVFRPGPAAAIEQLKRLVADKPDGVVRVGGHAFRADMPWLLAAGLDLRPFFTIPGDHDPKVMPRGFDTLYLAHASHETADGAPEKFKLENLAMRYTSCPRWDVRLQQWKDKYCKDNNLKDRDLEGYGMCPESVLVPYGLYDADATRRLCDIFWAHCVADIRRADPATGLGLDSRPGYLNSMKAWLGFLEMEMTGVTVDVPRARSLIALYTEKAAQLKAYLQQCLNWPTFNPKSFTQCCELLFGQALNGTVDKVTGVPKRLRPPDCEQAVIPAPDGDPTQAKLFPIPLDLTPIKTTGKPPKPWERVVADGETDRYNPSSDKETLGILAHDNALVRLLLDIRFLGHVGTSVLRPPRPPAATTVSAGGRAVAARLGALLDGDDPVTADGDVRAGRAIELDDPVPAPAAGPGEPDEVGPEDEEYDGGFLHYMDDDGRVRSHFYVAETGRCTSARPNCQNFAKQRDPDYQRILGYRDDKKGKEIAPYRHVFGGLCYKHAIRTICRASPGCVLIEPDLKSAEIAMLAWEADDQTMIDDVRRAMLPEDHPDFIDLHAATAIAAFHLDCPPTKEGLDAIGMLHIRTPAKNVRFGVPYGRSAAAIARQCREQGAPVSERDAQKLIDGWHARYVNGSRFLARCERRPVDPGWMAGPFKRLRRFPETSDHTVLEEMKRQAKNFTIQNGVADAISEAIYNIINYREANRSEGTFRIVLQIHDALLLEVPIEHVPWVWDRVLPLCMEERVPVTPLDLDGGDTILQGRPPYHFGIDRELYINWGEKLSWGTERENLLKAGLDRRYLPSAKKPKTA
jgi:uracil-DNA glycosylase family 4